MKKLRLLGLAAALALCALAARPEPAYAACTGKCTSNNWCRQCTGIPYAVCIGGYCAI